MSKLNFYTILDYQIQVLKDLENLEFYLYRSPNVFDQTKMDLVTEAKKKMQEFSSYLEDREKELYPEED